MHHKKKILRQDTRFEKILQL